MSAGHPESQPKMSFRSPRGGSTPNWSGHDGDEYDYARMPSATPTPPRANAAWYESTPKRPSTRAGHTRHFSSSSAYSPKPPANSPRYNSSGLYSTDVSSKQSSYSSGRIFSLPPRSPKRERRSSYTDFRASPPFGDSSDDEIVHTAERTYIVPGSRSRELHQSFSRQHVPYRSTNHHGYAQRAEIGSESPAYVTSPSAYDYDAVRAQASRQARAPTTIPGHRRSVSTAVPPIQRSSTVKPSRQTFKQPPPTARKGMATLEDAKMHGIPSGYSLKTWDPNLEPILVYGSVFDCNSLGKWIFDWVVSVHTHKSPFADIAGDLWILMIKLYGKSHKLENALEWNRSSSEDRNILDEFDAASERLKGRLRELIKHCEVPPGDKARSGPNAGVAFVEALFDKSQCLDETEKWMHTTRIWVQRFDVNCEPIIRNIPSA